MIKYDVVYVDDAGDKQDFIVDAHSLKDAINNVQYFCPDMVRVISCIPHPMFTDE